MMALFILPFASVLILLMYLPAQAHKVIVFAWVEGNTIFTEGKFSGGKKALHSQVLVFDREGQQLLEGKTDKKGAFSFRVPKLTDLRIVLNAGAGHRAEWMIPESEIREAITASGTERAEGPSQPRSSGLSKEEIREAIAASETRRAEGPSQPRSSGLSKEEIRELIDDSLDRKLRPIVRLIAESHDTGPSVTEVLGGIGYILGLMGVALYVKTRQRKNHLRNKDD